MNGWRHMDLRMSADLGGGDRSANPSSAHVASLAKALLTRDDNATIAAMDSLGEPATSCTISATLSAAALSFFGPVPALDAVVAHVRTNRLRPTRDGEALPEWLAEAVLRGALGEVEMVSTLNADELVDTQLLALRGWRFVDEEDVEPTIDAAVAVAMSAVQSLSGGPSEEPPDGESTG